MFVVAWTVASAASPWALVELFASGGTLKLRGGRSAPRMPSTRPSRAERHRVRQPSRYAVAYGEPGPPGAAPLQDRVSDGIRGDFAQVVGLLAGFGVRE